MYITAIPQSLHMLIVSAQTDNAFILPNSTTIEIYDSNLFSVVLESLADKKTIKYNRNVENITVDDLIISDEGNFLKSNYIHTLCSTIAKIFARIPQFTYFKYSQLNNYFNSKGFFITEENREEKYIEILEKDDEIMMAKLEEYLRVLTQLNSFDRMYQAFLNALDEIEMTEDEDKMDQIVKEALNYFSSETKVFVKVNENGWFSTITGKMEDVKPQI